MTLFDVPSTAGAIVSADGRYRYRLTRCWDQQTPPVAWIMLNPSTADAEQDDPTIRRCMGFARSWGYGGIVVVNLFAYRATDPDELARHTTEAVGLENNQYIHAVASEHFTVAAWGASVPHYWRHRPPAIVQQLRERGAELHHLGLTKEGHPRHPLYVRGDVVPSRWSR